MTDHNGFQSLSGFLMSCNQTLQEIYDAVEEIVSIPIGFSNEL